jgi:heme-degrading monooxygenase HmoA
MLNRGSDDYKRMLEIASELPGFIGAEALEDAEGFALFISYWKDLETIKKFKDN